MSVEVNQNNLDIWLLIIIDNYLIIREDVRQMLLSFVYSWDFNSWSWPWNIGEEEEVKVVSWFSYSTFTLNWMLHWIKASAQRWQIQSSHYYKVHDRNTQSLINRASNMTWWYIIQCTGFEFTHIISIIIGPLMSHQTCLRDDTKYTFWGCAAPLLYSETLTILNNKLTLIQKQQ